MLQKGLIYILALISVFYTEGFSQKKNCTCFISGTIKDNKNNEPVIGALVEIKSLNKSSFSDLKGEYFLNNICEGKYLLNVRLLGFESQELEIDLKHDFHWDVAMKEDEIHLESINITAKKLDIISGAQKTINAATLSNYSGQTFGEILSKISGISQLKTGNSISKPIIHGLHSNRIVTINNGIKHEAQQWGNEHAPEIDPFLAKKITVIKGASSVRYGPEAIGGVILVEPADLSHKVKPKTEINQFGMSNGNLIGLSAITEGTLHKFKDIHWRIQASAKKGGDISTPDYRMANTGVQEFNFSLHSKFSSKSKDYEVFFSQFNTKIGIFSGAHIGNITDLANAIKLTRPLIQYTPENFSWEISRPYQDIQHNLLKLKSSIQLKNNQSLNFTFGHQYNFRSEIDALRGTQNNAQVFKINTESLETVFNHNPIFNLLNGYIGFSALYQWNVSTGTLNQPLRSNVLIPNFSNLTFGLFAIERVVKQKFEIESGLRFDSRILQVNYLESSQRNVKNDNFLNNRFSASFSYKRYLSTNLKLSYSIATAWKPPVVSELYSNGVHHGSASYEVGDINLKPEKAFENSLIFDINFVKYNSQALFYVNLIDNYIFMAPTGNAVLNIRGAFPEFRYTQTKALLTGIDFEQELILNKYFRLSNQISFIYAIDITKNQPLIYISPNTSNTSFHFNLNNRLVDQITIAHQFVAKQNRVPSQSYFEVMGAPSLELVNGDYLAPPPAFNLFNFFISKAFKGKNDHELKFSIEANNLFNTTYRQYLNRFRYFTDEQGRNFVIRTLIKI